jgi:hypothetical protein
MAEPTAPQTALGDVAARQLANATKTVPQMSSISPRWLTHLLQWVPVEAGIYRLNKVKEGSAVEVDCSVRDERVLPQTFVDYEEHPREYMLSAVNTVLDVHTRVSDLYSAPYNQITEQLRLTIETIKERQESELINNKEYGLLSNIAPHQKIKTRKGAPTPDDLDELLTKVWKEPGFFLAHPTAIAAFGRECTRRGVPPPTAPLFGSQFLTWRGFPLIPTDIRRHASCRVGKGGEAIESVLDSASYWFCLDFGAFAGLLPQCRSLVPLALVSGRGGSSRRELRKQSKVTNHRLKAVALVTGCKPCSGQRPAKCLPAPSGLQEVDGLNHLL